jgi:peptide/nickel transport system permease protein
MAFVLAFAIGIPMGVYAGLKPDSLGARLIQIVSLVGISMPTFFVGIMLMLYFGVELGLMPTFGRGETVTLGFWTTGLLTRSGWHSIILPAFTLGLFQLTFIMRLVRAEMLEVMRSDYIKFARARGLSARRIHFRHALKNTLVPVMTIAGLQLGSIIAFGIITESVFQWPGIGLLFLQAISTVDIPVISTYLLLVAVIFVVINLVVDLLYYAVDPRLRAR